MREILFRGKQVTNGTWVYGNLIEDCYIVGGVIDWSEEYFNTVWWAMVEAETVGQYTGLKDKNGTEIYEGDIVKYGNSEENGTGKVIYDNGSFVFDWLDLNEFSSPIRYFQCANELEIIGNIYENPELLEENND